MKIVSELRRRNVIRMLVLYAIAAWLILQVAEVLIDLADLPGWIGTTTLWLLAIGLPIALTFSWFYEITPEGISLEKNVDRDASITHATGRRLDFIVISLLLAAVVLFAYDKWWAQGPSEKSIAVLPFVNMSDDASNEYFSDGISEELLNLLARIPELRVVSRSSAFFYKGKDINLVDVARDLNVVHILEGSVRKSENQVRITAQLIEARSDTHLWSETYDRTLTDIFSIQDEIAAIVVEKLKLTLLDAPPEVEEANPEAYTLVLQSLHANRQQTPEATEQALSFLKKALAIDPDYPRAWTELSRTYTYQVFFGQRTIEDSRALATEAIDRALMINSEFAAAHKQLAKIAIVYENDLPTAARHYQRAIELDPSDTSYAAGFLSDLSRLDEAIVLKEKSVSRDPVNPNGHYTLGILYLQNGHLDKALASFQIALDLNPGRFGTKFHIGLVSLLRNEPQDALATFAEEPDELFKLRGTVLALHDLGRTTEFEGAMIELQEQWGEKWPSEIAMAYAWIGEQDAAFHWLEKEIEVNGTYGWTETPLDPVYRNLHEDPRWQALLARVGVSASQLAAIDFSVPLPD
jgi:adenylate cyclase